MSKDKLWGGRFTQPTDKFVEEFTASIQFDKRLYHQDIRGSIAHARMLGKQGIIPLEDVEQIVHGLQQILQQIEAGEFDFSISLEDIHMNIEARLSAAIGEAGKRLHTGRSRNDQVALDIRLYLRDEIVEISTYLDLLIDALLNQAEANLDVIMPGFTHLQTAQPILFCPPPDGVCGDVQTRQGASGGLSQTGQCPAAGSRGAGRHDLSDRP